MQEQAQQATTDAAAAQEPANTFAQHATDAFHGLTDGDITSADLLSLWSAIGWPITKALVLIVAVLFLARWASRVTARGLGRTRLDPTLTYFLRGLVYWLVLLLGAVTVLQTFGIEATSFAAVIASVGFAIGMALSGTLGHVASGVMLLLFRPFRVGDVVNASGVTGKVAEIGLFTTQIDTFDNRRMIVPNSSVFGSNIENMTFHPTRRADVDIGVAYGCDVDEVRAVLERVVKNVEGSLQDPPPQVFLRQLGGSSVDWQLRVWAKTPDMWPVRERIIRDAKRALEEAGMTIPFPQMDVHIDGLIRRD